MTTTAAVALLAAGLALVSPARSQDYDLVIRNGRVVDGTGAPWRRADVAIRGDSIVAVASRVTAPARRTIDAAGRIVAPGYSGGNKAPTPPLATAVAGATEIRSASE